MRLIGLAVILTLSLALAPLALEAQQPGKVPRVGVLLTGDQSRHLTHVEAFRQGLRERGYVEGKNVVIEYRFGDGKLDRLPQLAAELVGLNVDLIVTSGTPPTRAALQATRTIPIVMTLVGDPIAAGFIASLAKPGGSITGLTQITGELDGKRLELLKEAFPKVSRVAVLFDPGSAAQEGIGTLRDTRMAAEALGVKLLSLELRGPTRTWAAHSERRRVSASVLCWSHQDPRQNFTGSASWIWRQRVGSRRCTDRTSLWTSVDSCRMARASPIYSVGPLLMWTNSSRAPSPRTSPLSSRRSSS